MWECGLVQWGFWVGFFFWWGNSSAGVAGQYDVKCIPLLIHSFTHSPTSCPKCYGPLRHPVIAQMFNVLMGSRKLMHPQILPAICCQLLQNCLFPPKGLFCCLVSPRQPPGLQTTLSPVIRMGGGKGWVGWNQTRQTGTCREREGTRWVGRRKYNRG